MSKPIIRTEVEVVAATAAEQRPVAVYAPPRVLSKQSVEQVTLFSCTVVNGQKFCKH
jgi:hypothetical protein